MLFSLQYRFWSAFYRIKFYLLFLLRIDIALTLLRIRLAAGRFV